MEKNNTKVHGTLIAIVGATATGKTAVGIDLARSIGGEIISADSMAVYTGLDIGTAKPTPEERELATFHLVDVVRPDEEFSVVEFKRLADEAIVDIVGRGRVPLLVGGTGLYLRAMTGALNIPVAKPDWALRERLMAEAAEFGNERLLQRLNEVDPITATRLHANDLKRIVRALEVHAITGMPISHIHETAGSTDVTYNVRLFGLTLSREVLYERIERRIDQQISDGLVEEVQGLLDKGYGPDLPAMSALGYKQIAAYLKGEYDFQTAIELFKRDTRRFAKRQLTLFRAIEGIHWVNAEGRSSAEVALEIERLLELKV